MKFRKLIEVGIANPIRQRRQLEGENRNLPHVQNLGDIVIVNLQRERMQDVLGVVEGDDRVFAPARDFAGPHGVENIVQAIRLRGRPGVWHDRFVHTRGDFHQLIDAPVGFRIIGIDADEKIVVLIEERLPRIVRHAVDDSPFVPCWNEDRDEFFRFIAESLDRHRWLSASASQPSEDLKVEK